MLIARKTYNTIIETCPLSPPETGGILGRNGDIVNIYEFDKISGNCFYNSYEPDVSFLNDIIKKWTKNGIEFHGIFHSHLSTETALSMPDKGYIFNIMRAIPVEILKLYFPIVFPRESMLSYIAVRKGNAIKIEDDIITLID